MPHRPGAFIPAIRLTQRAGLQPHTQSDCPNGSRHEKMVKKDTV